MSKYFELANKKNEYLNLLIKKYNEDPKEGKKNFVLSYLHTCSLFMEGFYLVTTEEKGKHYYHFYTYMNKDSFDLGEYLELSADSAIEFIENENNEGEYKIDYIVIETPDNCSLVFTTSEYKENKEDILEYAIEIETWIEDNKIPNLPLSLKENVINNSTKIDSDYKLPKETHKYIDLDIKPKELVVIGGRPYMGKTLLSINTMFNQIDKNNSKILYLNILNTASNTSKKMLALRAEISMNRVFNNSYTKDQYERVLRAFNKMNNIEVLNCPYFNIKEIKDLIISKKELNQNLVIIDGFDSIHYKDSYPKNDEIEIITKELKLLANELTITIIVTADISKCVDEREDKRPLYLHDFKVGTKLGEIADKVFTIYREEYYIKDEHNELENMEIYDLKNNSVIKCVFENQMGIVEEGEVIEEEIED